MKQVAIGEEAPVARMLAAREAALAMEEARLAKRAGTRQKKKKNPLARYNGNPNWVKGVSGNPSGRPKILVNLRDLAREHTETAIRVLIEVALDPHAAAGGRVAAAEAILDRGYGKPVQYQETTVSVIDRLSDGDRAAVLQILDAVAAARPAVEGGQLEALPAPDASHALPDDASRPEPTSQVVDKAGE